MSVPVLFLVHDRNDVRFTGLGLQKNLFDLIQFVKAPESIISTIINCQNYQLDYPARLYCELDKGFPDTKPDPSKFLEFGKFVNPSRLVPTI